jgi:hypothetical protein
MKEKIQQALKDSFKSDESEEQLIERLESLFREHSAKMCAEYRNTLLERCKNEKMALSGFIIETAPLPSELSDNLVCLSKDYQIDFGNHLRTQIKVSNNKIQVEGAINGWGNGVPLNEIKVIEKLKL